REDDEVAGLDARLEERQVLADVLRLLLHRHGQEHLRAQLRHHGGFGHRPDLALLQASLSGPPPPLKDPHPPLLLRSLPTAPSGSRSRASARKRAPALGDQAAQLLRTGAAADRVIERDQSP